MLTFLSKFSFQIRKCSTDCALDGIRIVDMSRIIAGPICTMMLGDLGAEVIKIEEPKFGDDSRHWPPYFGNDRTSCYFVSINRNKKSVCVDLKTTSGKQIIRDLVAKSDVLVENFIPGKMAQFGLDYENLSRINPRLINCSISGFGARGPYREKPGVDVIAASIGGLLSITGSQDGPPMKPGVAVTDIMTGLHAFGAIMTSLFYRNISGRGQKIDCDLLSTQISALINIASSFLNAGVEASRLGTAHQNIVPYQTFQTEDGYITIGAINDKQFYELCVKMKIPELVEDERFKKNDDRVANKKILVDILENKFKEKGNQEWCKLFEGCAFPFGPVNTISQVFEDTHVKHLNIVENVIHPTTGSMKLLAPPVGYDSIRNKIRSPPPTLGEHTAQVLKNILGYSDLDIERLKKLNVIA